MSNTRTTSQGQSVVTPWWQRSGTLALWALQVLLAFMFAGAGWLKISGAPEMVTMFATIGAGQWFRLLVGILEVAGAVGLVIPRLAGLAALGLSGVLVGAIATNLFILNADSSMAGSMLVIAALIAWRRWPQTRQMLMMIRPTHAPTEQ